MRWQVIVGSIGTVIDTDNGFEARQIYSEYKRQSLSGYGRAADESVVMMKDGDIYWEHRFWLFWS